MYEKLAKYCNSHRAGLAAVPYVVIATYFGWLENDSHVAAFAPMFLGLAVINIGTFASRRVAALTEEIATLRAQLATVMPQPWGDRTPGQG